MEGAPASVASTQRPLQLTVFFSHFLIRNKPTASVHPQVASDYFLQALISMQPSNTERSGSDVTFQPDSWSQIGYGINLHYKQDITFYFSFQFFLPKNTVITL